MAETIKLEVVTPKGAVLSEDVDIVTAPRYGGEFGVLANHAPFLSTIKIGVLSYKQEGTEDQLMISGGFCKVSDNQITFLVESAEHGRDIDVDRALLAKERAEKRLAEAKMHQEHVNQARAEVALQRSIARLNAAGHPTG
jgi:F-type H+-transporting ATPase subunit epsilon